jgi:hypothetical protein
MLNGAAPLPAYKLVMCFRDAKERELWKSALNWAEKRLLLVKQHDELTLADQKSAQQELDDNLEKSKQRREMLEAELAETLKVAEETRRRQEELGRERAKLLAETDHVTRAAAEERLRILQERDEFARNAESERLQIIREREALELFEAQQMAEQLKLQSKQEELQKSLKPLKAFNEKDNVGGFVAAAFKK